ncbi:MAG: aminoglycoside phosphotransferase family protein [Anaerolineae bacterium]|nr:aminoglycoside phosphotransferase family protein [Anaerolineae bacterium]
MSDPEVLKGGNSNRVIKEGHTVIRNSGVWSPFVHALLTYLTTAGFKESPVFIETIGDQERLSYFEGDVGNYPLKPYMQSDPILVESAQVLRRFHDLTQKFVIPQHVALQLSIKLTSAQDVICHNDFAPYNCVFQDGHLVGIIDFDTARPGSRIWDLAYAAYRFVPLTNDSHSLDCGWQPIPDRLARLKLFCDSYGLEVEDRYKLIDTVRERLQSLIDYMIKNASNLEHIPRYTDDLKYIADNQTLFTDAIIK